MGNYTILNSNEHTTTAMTTIAGAFKNSFLSHAIAPFLIF
jgi:hypothetical protein